MKSLAWIAILAAFGAAHVALADNNPDLKPFSMRLELPSDTASCGNRASSLGAIFAAQTGLTVTAANCVATNSIVEDGTTYNTVTLIINYMATAEVAPYQAIFGGTNFLGAPQDHSGLFVKYADCLHARGSQEAAFAAATGLQTFASYCDVSNDDTNPGYTLVVEAFGTPKAQLSSYAQDTAMGAPSPEITQAVVTTVTKGGGTVAYSDASHVFFYSATGLAIQVSDAGMFDNASQCTAQIAAVQQIYSNAIPENDPSANATALCVANGTTGATLNVVSANIEVDNDFGASSPQYSSFSDCMSDLARVLQNAHSSGASVMGGICAPNEDAMNGSFVVDLYTTMP